MWHAPVGRWNRLTLKSTETSLAQWWDGLTDDEKDAAYEWVRV